MTPRRALLAATALVAITSQQAIAQDQPADRDTANAPAADIIVVGSRIQSGFDRPTPVTVMSSAQLLQANPTSVTNALNQLPQLSGSLGPRQTASNVAGTSKGNFLNLRNVGSIRTLILLDGQRLVPTTADGLVDVNAIPELLVSNVDLVTGGVSAVYGSDAVTGVINYRLDKSFTGVRGIAQSGISTYGDGASYRLGAAVGHRFMENRAHLLLSIEHTESDPVQFANRKLSAENWLAVQSYPTGSVRPDGVVAGSPGSATNPFHFQSNVLAAYWNAGGGIWYGPPGLIGKQFNAAGQIVPYNPGGFASDFLNLPQIGGDGGRIIPLDNHLIIGSKATRAFGRIALDATPDLNFYVQGNYSFSNSRFISGAHFFQAPIYGDNAYLPASVAPIAALWPNGYNPPAPFPSTGLLCGAGALFCLREFPNELRQWDGSERVYNWAAQAGMAITLGNSWKGNLTVYHGETRLTTRSKNELQNAHYYASVDAVRDPQSGQIVCRVTLTNPGRYPGCLPYNPFGINTNTGGAALLDWLQGEDSTYTSINRMTSISGDLAGEFLSTWAGPISWAVSAEYRHSTVNRTSNSDPSIVTDKTGIRGISPTAPKFASTNLAPVVGSQDVKEAAIEVLVPLAKELPFAYSATLSGAYRYTDYSTSGKVSTWKIGGNWAPIQGVSFRVTRSRDIRAPTLFELFAGGSTQASSLNDPHTNRIGSVPVIGGGNSTLKPEIGNTFAAGVVLEPGFVPRLRVSVDYYHLKLTDAITTFSPLQLVQECEANGGSGPACAQITRPLAFSDVTPANFPTRILASPINAASLTTSGIDMEAMYSIPLSDGSIGLRLIANYVDKYLRQTSPTTPAVEQGGWADVPNVVPKFRATASINIEKGPVTVFLQERFIDRLKIGRQKVYVEQSLPATWYTDLTVNFKVPNANGNFNVFFNVTNLFNQQPRLFPTSDGVPSLTYPTIQSVYDVMGRYFTAGVKFQF